MSTYTAYCGRRELLTSDNFADAMTVIDGGKAEATTQEEASPYGNKYDKDLSVVEIAKRIRP